MNKLYQFLNKCRVTGNENYNYVSLDANFKGKFNLENDNYEQFIKIYAEAIAEGNMYSIAEKPKDIGPILVDIDLKSSLENYQSDRLYNNDMIFEVINAYRTAAKKYLNLDENELKVALFKKSKPTIIDDKIIKDGFHLAFYNVNANTKLRYLIRADVVDILKDSELLKNLLNQLKKLLIKIL